MAFGIPEIRRWGLSLLTVAQRGAGGKAPAAVTDGGVLLDANGQPISAASAPAGHLGGIRAVKGVLVQIGDSNTNGRPGWRNAYQAEWLAANGVFEGWTSYNLAQNGSILLDWATTEITNASNPTFASLPPADYNGTDPGPGRLARAINANPNLVIVSLGTNDENNPAARAAHGTESNLRTNLALLVNFLLANTSATILLRMPQPFAHEDFSGVTQWVNAAEAQEASRRLRQVYREWRNRNPRVEVYDSHAALFGDSCDNKALNCQDPNGLGPLISDSLHPSDLGYRRIAEQIAKQFDLSRPNSAALASPPIDLLKTAVWAVTLRCRDNPVASGTTSTFLSFDFSRSNVLLNTPDTVGVSAGVNRTLPISAQRQAINTVALYSELDAFSSLLAISRKSLVRAYSWATGTTTQLTGYSLSQIVTSATPHYVILGVTGANLGGFGGGNVTFYLTDPLGLPFLSRPTAQVSMTAATKKIGPPAVPVQLADGFLYRPWVSSTTPVVTLYLQNQIDGRYVTGSETFAAPGKPVGTFTFATFGTRAQLVFDATHYPSGGPTLTTAGEIFHAQITTGAIADLGGDAHLVLSF